MSPVDEPAVPKNVLPSLELVAFSSCGRAAGSCVRSVAVRGECRSPETEASGAATPRAPTLLQLAANHCVDRYLANRTRSLAAVVPELAATRSDLQAGVRVIECGLKRRLELNIGQVREPVPEVVAGWPMVGTSLHASRSISRNDRRFRLIGLRASCTTST